MTALGYFLVSAILLVPALLIAIPLHELGHAAAAYFLGDRSVRYFGYFKYNPRRLLDLVGTIAVFIALVGWGKKIPVQPNRISSAWQRIVYELGGPAANLLAAILLGIPLRFFLGGGVQPGLTSWMALVAFAVYAIWFLNVSLFAFQLLPIPGLDGWGVIEAIFRPGNSRFFFSVDSRRREILMVAIGILLVGSLFRIPVLSVVMSPFYTAASLISLGQCSGYGIPNFNGLSPCLVSAA